MMMGNSNMVMTGRVIQVMPADNACRVQIELNSMVVLARFGVVGLEGTTSLLLVPDVGTRCWVSKLSVQDYVIVGCDQVKDILITCKPRYLLLESTRNTSVSADGELSVNV